MTLNYIILGIIGGQEIIIIALILLVLFGGKKIPELMRGMGKGVKEFKDGVNGLDTDLDETPEKKEEPKKKNKE